MKVLNISLEKKLFEEGSRSRQRVLGYGRLFARFDLLILTGRGRRVVELENMEIRPTNSLSRPLYLLDAYLSGKRMIKKYGHDVISAQDPFETGLIAWLLAKKYGIKLQIQLHGDYFGSGYWRRETLLNRLRYYLGRFIVKKADAIRVVSYRIKNSLVESGLASDKISVVPIFTEIRNKAEGGDGKNNGKFIFLTVGRLVGVKNIGLQIEAMAEVIKKHSQAELWIVGDGPERKSLELKVKSLKLEGSVKLLGQKNQEELSGLYQAADVFVLTSNSEGWGLVAVEAAGFGLPIVMTDVGCAGELIRDNEGGMVIPVGDSQSLEKAMFELMEDGELRKKLGRGAQAAVSGLPGQEESGRLYQESLEKIFK